VTDSYGDLVAAALRADAEAARAEIRAAGIACPSCGVNLADLPDGHALAVTGDDLHPGPGPWTAECGDGQPVTITLSVPVTEQETDAWVTMGNVLMWDDYRRRVAEASKGVVGEGPANFTGLLDVLGGSTGG